MIDINLIPIASRKKNISGAISSFTLGLPQEIVVGISFAVVVVLIVSHLLLLGVLGSKAIILQVQKVEWVKLNPQKTEMDALGSELKEIKKKTDNLGEIISTRSTGWSRKLNVISDAITNGMWIRRVVLDSKSLSVEGAVISKNQNEIALISSFVDYLKKDQSFMRDVSSVEVGTIQRVKRGLTDVAHFSITVKFKS